MVERSAQVCGSVSPARGDVDAFAFCFANRWTGPTPRIVLAGFQGRGRALATAGGSAGPALAVVVAGGGANALQHMVQTKAEVMS